VVSVESILLFVPKRWFILDPKKDSAPAPARAATATSISRQSEEYYQKRIAI
jgi:hypothetical protein